MLKVSQLFFKKVCSHIGTITAAQSGALLKIDNTAKYFLYFEIEKKLLLSWWCLSTAFDFFIFLLLISVLITEKYLIY